MTPERLGRHLLDSTVDGRFKVVELLESGAMGDVYLVRQMSLGMNRALKVINVDLTNREQESKRFRREALALSRLTHENIVQVIDFGQLSAPYRMNYLVMEYVDGGNAQAAVDRHGPVPSRQAGRVLRQVADALEYAHVRGIVHRDLKPANILLRGDPHDRAARVQAKIADFGMVRIVTDETLTKITAAEQIMGTPRFMAPEQCRRTEVGPPADIYAFGGIAFFLISGTPVFEARSALEMIAAHARRVPERLSSRCPKLGLDPAVDDLVFRCLAKQPEERPTAGEVRRLLDKMGDQIASAEVAETPPAETGSAALSARGEVGPQQGVITADISREEASRIGALIWSDPGTPAGGSPVPRPVLEALFNQISTQLMNVARRILRSDPGDPELRRQIETIEALDARVGDLEMDAALQEVEVSAAGPAERETATARLVELQRQSAEMVRKRYAELGALFGMVLSRRHSATGPVVRSMLDDLENLVEQYLRLGGAVDPVAPTEAR